MANYIDVQDPLYGAIGNGSADDTTALNNAFAAGATQGLPVFLPAGIYRTTAALSVVGDNVMIYGAGGILSKIKPDAYSYDCLTITAKTVNTSLVPSSGIAPSGWIKDISIEGITSWITGTTAALKLNGMRQFDVENVNVSRMPIGFDLINNCYAVSFENCRANLGGMPLNLRIGIQSGNDITFYNCWFAGLHGAVCVSPNSGGFHFWGGQMTGGANQAAAIDEYGVITLGKDYVDSLNSIITIGNVGNVNFDGIDFEGSRGLWQVRAFGQYHLTIQNSSFLSTVPSASIIPRPADPVGIVKSTGSAAQIKLQLIGNNVAGAWSSPIALDITGTGSTANVFETGTAYVNGTPTFGGVAETIRGLLEQSRLALGTCIYRNGSLNKVLIGSTTIRSTTTNKFEVSFDWGLNWIPLQQTLSGATAARPTTNTYVGQFYFDTTLGKPIYRNAANTGWVDGSGITV